MEEEFGIVFKENAYVREDKFSHTANAYYLNICVLTLKFGMVLLVYVREAPTKVMTRATEFPSASKIKSGLESTNAVNVKVDSCG